MSRRVLLRAALLAAAVALGAPLPGAGQPHPDPAQGLRGLIVDARTGAPLEGASVTVEPVPAGLLLPGGAGNPGFAAARRMAATGADGGYRFARLAPGRYRLHVARIGYRPATLEVDFQGAADPRVSVALVVEPVELEPLTVVGARPDPLPGRGRVSPAAEDQARVEAERIRQARWLQSDARVLTSADLLEAATLGETDLLRALHRLPGVSAADDWSAEPWTRGARWDETRIYLDGLPLRDPLHAGGAFTALAPDAVGSLAFHPGVRPAALGDASAGVVDLRSRAAGRGEGPSGLAQLSLLSVRGSADLPVGEGGALAVSGRRSWYDQIADSALATEPVPYRFADLSGRWDQRLSAELALEVSGAWTENSIFGDVTETLKGSRGAWGNRLGRATLELRRGGVRTRLTVGRAHYDARLSPVAFDEGRPDLVEAVQPPPTDNRMRTDLAALTVQPTPDDGSVAPWSAGWERRATRVAYDGPAAWPHPGAVDAGRLVHEGELALHAFWGEVRAPLPSGLELSVGGRLEVPEGGAERDLRTRLAPRAVVSWSPRSDLRVSAAAGRHHQREQAVAAAGFSVGPALTPTHLWALAGGGVPTLRSDIATLGAELWLAEGWLASATAWGRRTDGVLTPRPDSGYVRARPALLRESLGEGWTTGRGRAAGVEVGLRRLAGRWTAAVAWSLSRSTLVVDGVSVPAPGDRRHTLDGSLTVKTGARSRLGMTVTAASGAPFTRFYPFRCPGDRYCPAPEEGAPPVVGFAEPAGAERLPDYRSVDLHWERTAGFLGGTFGLFVQVRNVLSHGNASAYTGSVLHCGPDGAGCRVEDRFDGGMPRLPLLGVWLRL